MMVDTVGFQAPFLSTVSAGEAWQILEDFPENPHYHELKENDREVLKLFYDDIDSKEKRQELVEALNSFKNDNSTPSEKTKAKSILRDFF